MNRRGVWLALLAAALFGASTPLAKALLTENSPQLLAGLLYLGSGTGLLVVWLIRRGGPQEASLSRNDLPWLAGAVTFGGVIGPLLLMCGLLRTPASSASLLLNLEAVFTSVLAWLLFREHVSVRIALGMLAIVAGGALLSWEDQISWRTAWGPLAIATACFCWAIDNNLTQKVSAADPMQIAQLKGLVAGIVNISLAFSLGAQLPAPLPATGALLVGFLGYGLSLVCFVLALRQLGTARTGAYFSLAPFIGATLSLILYREQLTWPFLSAAALMALGLWLHLTARLGQQLLNRPLGLLVLALAEMAVPDSALTIDQVDRRPVLISEATPDPKVVIHRNWVVHPEVLHAPAGIGELPFKLELGRVHANHDQSLIPIFLSPGTDVGNRADPVDTGIGPELDQHDFSPQALRRQWRGVDPFGGFAERSQLRGSGRCAHGGDQHTRKQEPFHWTYPSGGASCSGPPKYGGTRGGGAAIVRWSGSTGARSLRGVRAGRWGKQHPQRVLAG